MREVRDSAGFTGCMGCTNFDLYGMKALLKGRNKGCPRPKFTERKRL